MSVSTPAVVLVHGLWMPGFETTLLRRRLARAGYAPFLFRYGTVREGLGANAARLAEFLRRLPHERVHFVGHSLGGVLILTMLREHGCERAGRVVCLGSPLCGSRAAVAFARWPGGKRMLGRCMGELIAAHGLPPWAGSAEVGVIAGNLPIAFGRLVCAFNGPNDGTVAVAETQLPGTRGHLTLPASHFGLLWSARVSRQVVFFLEHGAFDARGDSDARLRPGRR
jgi:pimeloyl-ACP methyl ester carboxylesterase